MRAADALSGAGGVGRPRGSSAGLAASILDGIAYARRTPTVLWLLLLLLAVMSVGFPAVASLGPVWVTQVLGLSYGQFGVFAAFWGIGALVTSAAMTHVGHFPRKGWLTGAAAVGFAACVVVWGFSRSVPLSALMNACLGGLITTTQVSARSLVQRTVPNAIQGRVLSLFLLTMATAQVMTLPFAALAQRYSLAVVVPAMGWLCLALALAIVLLRPEVRRAGHTPPGDGPAHTPHA